MPIAIDKSWRINASRTIDLPLSASMVWGQMRDLRRFITLDPLHARVVMQPAIIHPARPASAGLAAQHCNQPRSCPLGSALIIEHRCLGIGPDRIGRVLRWREGQGYAISDLSQLGVRVGFPHVCLYQLHPINDRACRLTVAARGRWTARWLPRCAVKLWLHWVLRRNHRPHPPRHAPLSTLDYKHVRVPCFVPPGQSMKMQTCTSGFGGLSDAFPWSSHKYFQNSRRIHPRPPYGQ